MLEFSPFLRLRTTALFLFRGIYCLPAVYQPLTVKLSVLCSPANYGQLFAIRFLHLYNSKKSRQPLAEWSVYVWSRRPEFESQPEDILGLRKVSSTYYIFYWNTFSAALPVPSTEINRSDRCALANLEEFRKRAKVLFFFRLVGENIILMSQALSRKLVIPEFPEFCGHLKGIFQRCAMNKQGKVSQRIFFLNRVSLKVFSS